MNVFHLKLALKEEENLWAIIAMINALLVHIKSLPQDVLPAIQIVANT